MCKRSVIWGLLISLGIFSSCKKNSSVVPLKDSTHPGTYMLFAADETFNLGLSNAPSSYTSIYYCKLDGSGITAVTSLDPGYYSYRASWSPDGTKVVFTRGNADDSYRALCISSVPGGNFTAITQGHQVDYGSISPDGKKVAYAKSTIDSLYNYDVYIANINGSNEQRLTYFGDDGGAVMNLQWGSDYKIYFNAAGQHHPEGIYNIDTTGLKLNSLVPGVDFLGLSHDGKKILYDLSYGLFTCNVDGTNVKKIFNYDNNTPNSLLGASWAADDSEIYSSYTDYPNGLFGIYRINSDGTGVQVRILPGFYEYPVVH